MINPVATDAWNESDGEYLSSVVRDDTRLTVVNIERGPLTIEGFHDEAHAVPGVLRVIRENRDRFDGMMINCFADPGLMAARELLDTPVTGAAESAIVMASMLGHRFSIISPLSNGAGMVEMKVACMGLLERLGPVLSIDTEVSDLDKDPERTVEAIVSAVRGAGNQADVAILGCTGMAFVSRRVAGRLDVPVVEPAAAAVKMLEVLLDLGLTHSRHLMYMRPALEKIKGYE